MPSIPRCLTRSAFSQRTSKICCLAAEITSIDFNAGARWAFPLGDGRGLMPIYSLVDPADESAGYISDVYEVFQESEPVAFPFGDPSDQVQARLSDIVRLR